MKLSSEHHPVPIDSVLAGRYLVLRRLGEGGMASVYLAYDKNLNADVAIKFPDLTLLKSDDFKERFLLETRALVNLRHPNILTVIDVGEENGIPFAVMDYLSGGSINDQRYRDKQDRFIPVAPVFFYKWLNRIADALDFMHRKGYVHRDVKPDNILFDEDRNAFLSDFGIAKVFEETKRQNVETLTQVGSVIGTPEYIAPEVNMGRNFDGRSDQFSLAVMVYELLLGERPFTGPTPMAIMLKQNNGELNRVERLRKHCGPGVVDVLKKSLSVNPEERYLTCAEFESALATQFERIKDKVISKTVVSKCPNCSAAIAVQPNWVGQLASCNHCNKRLKIEPTGLFTPADSLTNTPAARLTEDTEEQTLVPDRRTAPPTADLAEATKAHQQLSHQTNEDAVESPKQAFLETNRVKETDASSNSVTNRGKRVVIAGLAAVVIGIMAFVAYRKDSLSPTPQNVPRAEIQQPETVAELPLAKKSDLERPLENPTQKLPQGEIISPSSWTIAKLSTAEFQLQTIAPLKDEMKFVLGNNAPPSITIGSQSGLLRWTPGPEQNVGAVTVPVSLMHADTPLHEIVIEANVTAPDVQLLERDPVIDQRFIDSISQLRYGEPMALLHGQVRNLQWLDGQTLVGSNRASLGTLDVMNGQLIERLELQTPIRCIISDPRNQQLFVGTGNDWDNKTGKPKQEHAAQVFRIDSTTWRSELLYEQPAGRVDSLCLTSDDEQLVAVLHNQKAIKIQLASRQTTELNSIGGHTSVVATNHPSFVLASNELIDIDTDTKLHRYTTRSDRGNARHVVPLRGGILAATCNSPDQIVFHNLSTDTAVKTFEAKVGWEPRTAAVSETESLVVATDNGRLLHVSADADTKPSVHEIGKQKAAALISVPGVPAVLYQAGGDIFAIHLHRQKDSAAVSLDEPEKSKNQLASLGKSFLFDGKAWISTEVKLSERPKALSIEIVCSPQRLGRGQFLVGNPVLDTLHSGAHISLSQHNELYFRFRGFRIKAKRKPEANKQIYLAGLYRFDEEKDEGVAAFYLNGEHQAHKSIPGDKLLSSGFVIGAMRKGELPFFGEIKQVRISNVIRELPKTNQPFLTHDANALLAIDRYDTSLGLAIETKGEQRRFPIKDHNPRSSRRRIRVGTRMPIQMDIEKEIAKLETTGKSVAEAKIDKPAATPKIENKKGTAKPEPKEVSPLDAMHTQSPLYAGQILQPDDSPAFHRVRLTLLVKNGPADYRGTLRYFQYNKGSSSQNEDFEYKVRVFSPNKDNRVRFHCYELLHNNSNSKLNSLNFTMDAVITPQGLFQGSIMKLAPE